MKKLVWAIVIAAAIFFGLQGGEYSTRDLFKQRARKEKLRISLDSLQRQVDSLKAVKRAIETDAAVQERLAREEFGMVRGDKELLYRFVEDSAAVSPSR
jgi:cell division protein FtsB